MRGYVLQLLSQQLGHKTLVGISREKNILPALLRQGQGQRQSHEKENTICEQRKFEMPFI